MEVSGCGDGKSNGVDTNLYEIDYFSLMDTQDKTNVYPFYSITDRVFDYNLDGSIKTTYNYNTWWNDYNVYNNSNGFYRNVTNILINIYNFTFKNYNFGLRYIYNNNLFHPSLCKNDNYGDGSDGYYTYEQVYNIISSAFKYPNRAILFEKYTRKLNSYIMSNTHIFVVNNKSINNKYSYATANNYIIKNLIVDTSRSIHVGNMKANDFNIYEHDSIEFRIYRNPYTNINDLRFLIAF